MDSAKGLYLEQNSKPIIYVVDDDESVRKALKRLFYSAGFEALTFESAHLFLCSEYRDQNACLITDIKMPGLNGIELQRKLIYLNRKLPVIFMTAFDDEETRILVNNAGAAGYFRKPVDDKALLDNIQKALNN